MLSRHGGPYDRGAADSYYGRAMSPHYYQGGTYMSPKVEEKNMTPEEISAYVEGFRENEERGEHKIW